MRACSLLLVLCLCASAFAQTADSDTAEAKKRYNRGLAHFNLREYQKAADEFAEAYRLRPDPVFLYNLAQADRLAGNHEQALHFYRTYLRQQPNAPNRAEVEERIANLEKVVAESKKASAAPPRDTLGPPPTGSSPSTSAPEATPAATSVAASADHAEPKQPVYKKWWLWTIVGVVVVGAAVGVGVGVGTHASTNSYPGVSF